MSNTSTRVTGNIGEQYACDYLRQQGLTVIEKNFQCKCGEIDLIMRQQQYIVFVEVRYRTSNNYGSAVETISYAKQRRIIKTAQYFLLSKRWYERYPCRFDVIGVTTKQDIQWIPDAFHQRAYS